jgi:hypothetical protein
VNIFQPKLRSEKFDDDDGGMMMMMIIIDDDDDTGITFVFTIHVH